MTLEADELAALHLAAIMTKLREEPGLTQCAFDGQVPNRLERYVRVYTNSGVPSQTRFASLAMTRTFTYVVHSVGLSADQALWINARVHRQLDDARLAVSGRILRRLKHAIARPIDTDKSGPDPLHFIVDQFDLVSEPAA